MKKIVSCVCLLVMSFYMILPVFALDEKSISINRTGVRLKSRIGTKYSGLQYKIKNNTNQKLNVERFIIDDAASGQAAYMDIKRNGWGAAGVTIVYGWNYALSTLGLALVGSFVAAPFFVVSSAFGNFGAKREMERMYSESPEGGYLKKHEEIKFKALVEKGKLPTVTLLVSTADADEKYIFTSTPFGNYAKLYVPQTNIEKKAIESPKKTESEVIDSSDFSKSEETAEKKSKTENITPKTKETLENQSEENSLKKYNTGVTTDPAVKLKKDFNEDKNFVTF